MTSLMFVLLLRTLDRPARLPKCSIRVSTCLELDSAALQTFAVGYQHLNTVRQDCTAAQQVEEQVHVVNWDVQAE